MQTPLFSFCFLVGFVEVWDVTIYALAFNSSFLIEAFIHLYMPMVSFRPLHVVDSKMAFQLLF